MKPQSFLLFPAVIVVIASRRTLKFLHLGSAEALSCGL